MTVCLLDAEMIFLVVVHLLVLVVQVVLEGFSQAVRGSLDVRAALASDTLSLNIPWVNIGAHCIAWTIG